jgi:cytochrome b subunit of formate dehydrogenase
VSEENKNTAEAKTYLRMSVNERIQHALLASSFIVLVITGFGLKFPEAFWVKWIVAVVGEGAFEIRGFIHRVASIVMVGVSFYHLYYVGFTPRGRQLVKDFWFRKQDILDLKLSLLFLLGKTQVKPKYGRFSYIEKMEYWAVAWGTIIMGLTGGFLWFENTFLKFIGTSGMDIATAIHYYEAILASLAIVVWHFYFVFLNPDVFPMNKAWFKGTLSREEMEHEHPLELEEIEKEELKESEEENTEIISDNEEIISDETEVKEVTSENQNKDKENG